MGYDVSDTEIMIGIEVTSIVEHLSTVSVESTLEVDKSTKALLKKYDVPMKGRGNTIEVHLATALKVLVEQFQTECNQKREQWDEDYRYHIETAIQDMLEACLEDSCLEVRSKRYGDFYKDYVEQTVGRQPFKKKKAWGTITDPMSGSGKRKRFPIFVVLREGLECNDLPEDLIKEGGEEFQEAWEFLAGQSVRSLLLLTVQTGG